MIRTAIFILFSIIGSLITTAQEIRTFKGTVQDAITHSVIPFATIAAYNHKKELIDGTSTDDKGQFRLELSETCTYFEISFIGYDTYKKSFAEIKSPKNILIQLTTTTNALDEIIIETNRTTTQLKIDRKIIDLGTDIQQSGITALEAFDQISDIQTDLGTGSLSLRGSGNVRLLVNGKPSGLNATELLEQLSASSINRIEIITSPSAKNQADGLSGIINIIVNKDSARGLNTTINVGFGTKRYTYGFDGNYNYSWLNFRINASQAGREMDSKQNIFQRYSNGDTRDFFAPHDFSGLVRKISTGLDFFIDDNNELSLGLDYTNDFHSFYNNTFYTNVSNREDFIYTRNSSHLHKTTNLNANYRSNFNKENHYVELDYQFSNNDNTLPAEGFEDDIFLFKEERININKLHALAIDYSLPLSENINLETGISWNKRDLESNLTSDFANTPETLEIFNYEESLLGVYALSNFKYNKLNWQAGFRYEHFNSNSLNRSNNQTTDLTFSNLFPSIHISYEVNDHNTINLGFSRRTSRPNFRNINPFQSRNQYFEWVANPGLKPEFSNNIELNYQFKKEKFVTSIATFYRYRTDIIEQLITIDNDGVQSITFDNIGEKQSYGIELDANYKFTPFWDSQASFNYYFTDIDQNIPITWDELYSSNFIFKNTFKINNKLSADITFRQNLKTQNTFAYIDARNRIDLAARLKLLDNRLTMNLRIIDIFDNNLFYRTTQTPQVNQNEIWRFQSQTFGYQFNIKYKLFENKGKTRNRKDRNYRYGGTTD